MGALPAEGATQLLPADHWHLRTADTWLTLAVVEDRPTVCELAHPRLAWNWTGARTAIPLVSRVESYGSVSPVRWAYQDALVDERDGMKVELRFTCSSPKLQLVLTAEARPHAGPVEFRAILENRSGGPIRMRQEDVVVGDCSFTSDGEVTLWRFNRLGYIPSSGDPALNAPEPGIAADLLSPNSAYESTTRNDSGWARDAWLPFHVLDVGADHGLYLGYVASFGRFRVSTADDARHVSYRALLWDTGTITIAAGTALRLPGLFLGTYTGDADDAGNRMKSWFWRTKVPKGIRENPGEPLIEFGAPTTEAKLLQFLETYPLADWGGELAKMDIEWMTPTSEPGSWNSQMHTCRAWDPDPGKWPNGLTAGDIAHRHRVKLSLYLFDMYRSADLGTPEGRTLAESALLDRFDRWHYDYYRSDFFPEGTYDYARHVGFMAVLDSVMAKRPGFRYEHCSGGGALKDFDSLQRIAVMTTEDSAGALHHRKACHANTYAINPVQLKCDISMNFGQTGHSGDELTGNPWFEPYLDTPEYVAYCLRTGFLGAIMVVGGEQHSAHLTENQVNGYRTHWPLYKQWMRPILRGADVYHILPFPDGIDWDGMQYYNRELDKGVVLLFKPSAEAPEAKMIRLKGLERGVVYSLTFVDRPKQNCRRRGAELMGDGLAVTEMVGIYASEIIWIQPARGPGARPTERQKRI